MNEEILNAVGVAITEAGEDPAAAEESSRDAIPDGQTGIGGSEAAEPFLTTLFNHEPRRLDRSEAERLVQLGLFSEPHIEQLRYLAGLSDQKSVKDMLTALISQREQQMYDEIASRVSDPALARQIADERIAALKGPSASDELTESTAADRDLINRRLAEEFVELQRDFPGVSQFSDLPDTVKREAAEQGIALRYAYALHACREQAKINAADTAAREAARSASDSFKSAVSDGTSPEMTAVYKALWGE